VEEPPLKKKAAPAVFLPRRQRLGIVITLFLILPLLTSGGAPPRVEQIRERGTLYLITRPGASTYYSLDDERKVGFEYELASRFAATLGVRLEVEEVETFDGLLPALERARGDFIGANFTLTPGRAARAVFTPPYTKTRAVVIYRAGEYRPREIADLVNSRLAVIAGSSYAEMLAALAAETPDLEWSEALGAGIEDLLEMVQNGELDYTLLDENLFRLQQAFFPKLSSALAIGPVNEIGWAFAAGGDFSLRDAAARFLQRERASGGIAALQRNYYSHFESYDQAGAYTFLQRIASRLPHLQPIFEDTAAQYGMDWRLLAAVGYQESHWNARAVSRTGVSGVMMLTRTTAGELGVANRRDPAQSIDGGARYLSELLTRLPERIGLPDRLWLALAAYNIGMGHLEDARILTERQGGDPDRWEDVAERLPLLSRERHYRTLKHGYARGYEALQYVTNIRTYFQVLTWLDHRQHPLLAANKPVDAKA